MQDLILWIIILHAIISELLSGLNEGREAMRRLVSASIEYAHSRRIGLITVVFRPRRAYSERIFRSAGNTIKCSRLRDEQQFVFSFPLLP